MSLNVRLRTLIPLLLSLAVLSLPAWSESPEQKIETLYEAHAKSRGEAETVKAFRHYFTPGFLKVIERNQQLSSQVGGTNFLTVGNGGWGDYEVHPGWSSGEVYIVPVVLYCGLRASQVRTDPKLRREWPVTKAHFQLIDLGSGYQIFNIEFLPTRKEKGYRARQMLERNSDVIEAYLKKQQS